MAKQRKHSSSKVSDFFDYLGGKLSGKERNAFERRLQKDPFEAEAAEGLGMVTRAEMEEDLHAASAKIRRRIRRKRRIAWYSTAAAVASLMIVATIFFNVDDGSMDRYSTSPEFEEAVREPPSAAGVEKKRARKDAIPEAEELQEELRQDEDKLQEELRQDKDLVQGERLSQDEDRVLEEPSTANVKKKRTRKDAIPEAEELREELVLEEDKVLEEGLMLDEDKVLEEGLMLEEDKVLEEGLRQEESTQKMNAMEVADDENVAVAMDEKVATAAEINATKRAVGENTDDEIVFVERDAGAAERSKRTAPVAQNVPTAQKVLQDEIPDMEEIQTLQVQAVERDISQPLQGKIREQAATQSLQGQIQGVNISEPLQGQLTGIVYSAESMEPLPGVSLFVKGTETGTVSGVDGSFSLNAGDDSGSTLVANFIGMQTEEIPIEAGRPLEIAMVPDHVQLDEVVVVGHAVSKKASLTSAVSRVETDPVTQNEYITASPVDGITAYREYIDTTLVYPAETGSADKEVVVLKFSVTPDGRPENFRVIRSPGDTFSQEVIRVISEGPDWKPTTRNGNYVDDEVRLRVVFRTDK